MTKNDMIKRISADTGVSSSDAANVYASIFNNIAESVMTGEKVTVAGFGTFKMRESAQRQGRNPRTGESITIQASKTVSFKPSSSLKQTA